MQSKHFRIVMLAVTFGIISIAVLATGSRHTNISVKYDSAELGTVWAQDQLSHRVTLFNETSEPLEISHFATSCGCTSVYPDKLTISPKGSAAVDVLIDTVDGKSLSDVASFFPKSFSIVPKLIDGRHLEKYQLSANVRSPMSLDISKLRFTQPLITRHRADLAVNLTLCTDVASLEVLDIDRSIEVACHQKEKQTCDLSVAFNGNAPLGPFEARIVVRPKMNDGSYLPKLSLHVVGNVVSDLVLNSGVVYLPRDSDGSASDSSKKQIIRFEVTSRSGARVNGLQIRGGSNSDYLGTPSFNGIGTSSVNVEMEFCAREKGPSIVTLLLDAQVEGQDADPSLEVPIVVI